MIEQTVKGHNIGFIIDVTASDGGFAVILSSGVCSSFYEVGDIK